MAKIEVPLVNDRNYEPNARLFIQKNERFTNKFWADNYGKTTKEARRLIRQMLKSLNYTVNKKSIKLDKLKQSVGTETLTGIFDNDAKYTGVVTALCNSRLIHAGNESPDLGQVIVGQPVVFDTTTGYTLTGINRFWMPDEFQVFGTALENAKNTTSLQKLPILLHKQHHTYSQFYVARLTEDLVTPKPAKAIIIGHYGYRNQPSGVNYGSETPPGVQYTDDYYKWAVVDNLNEYTVKVFSLNEVYGVGLNPDTSLTSIADGTKTYPRYYSGQDVTIAYEHFSSRWIIVNHKFVRPVIDGVGSLGSGVTATIKLQKFNSTSNTWEDILYNGQNEFATVTNYHFPSFGGNQVRITAAYDWDSKKYVVEKATLVDLQPNPNTGSATLPLLEIEVNQLKDTLRMHGLIAE